MKIFLQLENLRLKEGLCGRQLLNGLKADFARLCRNPRKLILPVVSDKGLCRKLRPLLRPAFSTADFLQKSAYCTVRKMRTALPKSSEVDTSCGFGQRIGAPPQGVRQQGAVQFFGQSLVAEWSAGARKCGKPGFLRSRRRSKKWPHTINF